MCICIYICKCVNIYFVIVVVQSLSHVWLFATPWTAACQASLSFTTYQSLLRFTSIESSMLSNHLILCFPLLLLPSIFPSIRGFCDKPALQIRWPKYWSFSAGFQWIFQGWFPLGLTSSISLQSKGFSRVFSSTMIQKHQDSPFFMVHLSHPYMTTRKSIGLTCWRSDVSDF